MVPAMMQALRGCHFGMSATHVTADNGLTVLCGSTYPVKAFLPMTSEITCDVCRRRSRMIQRAEVS